MYFSNKKKKTKTQSVQNARNNDFCEAPREKKKTKIRSERLQHHLWPGVKVHSA